MSVCVAGGVAGEEGCELENRTPSPPGCAYHASFNPHNGPKRGVECPSYPHYTDEETESGEVKRHAQAHTTRGD